MKLLFEHQYPAQQQIPKEPPARPIKIQQKTVNGI